MDGQTCRQTQLFIEPQENKAVYTTASVTCDWALGRGIDAKTAQNCQTKQMVDGLMERPTDGLID